MNLRRIWIMFKSRNVEFFRDRAAFGWNFLFPFLIVIGFGIIFGNKNFTEYKVGIIRQSQDKQSRQGQGLPESFLKTQYIKFIYFNSLDEGLKKIHRNKIDFLIKEGKPPYEYWVSDTSQRGYIMKKIFQSSLIPEQHLAMIRKKEIKAVAIRYIDWLFPGILAMNMMFSSLWGVGYIIVRYRKNGVLKRLKATPLNALEYLTAQMFSRVFLLMFTLIVVWIGCDLFFSFKIKGSYFDLVCIFFLGSLNLTSIGLLLAARGTSEEFTSGVLNFISLPMMFLSEVWFSLEGAPKWIIAVSQIFPLTHLLSGVRKIMNEGAGLLDIGFELSVLSLMTFFFVLISATLFSWD